MSMNKIKYLFLFIVLSHLFYVENGFYVPGVAPKEFLLNDIIDVRAIKITSIKTVIPYEYYSLPFCKPVGKLHYESENLGEIMRGDRIVNTPYEIHMKQEKTCSFLCGDNFKININKKYSQLLRQRIAENYYVHLLVDNLPCITPGDSLHDGYKIGWYDESSNNYYVNNHLDIVLKYHESVNNIYRVVGFEVKPKSIDHSHYENKKNKICNIQSIESVSFQKVLDNENSIVWSYSVRFESSEIPWASRWDVYLKMNNVQIHWLSIFNSLIAMIFLTIFLSAIIIRTVRRDIAKYNCNEDVEDTLEETGWKLVHGDVFRPPRYIMFLVNLIGTGIQLLGMVAVTVTFAMLGMLSPSSRGSLTSVAVFLYCFMGLISGYHSGRLYKTLRGNKPKRCAFRTAILFPALILGTGFVLNFFLISKNSSGAIPLTTMIVLLILWFGIDLPLVFLGFHFGYRKQIYAHPVRNNQIPRQVPDQPWYLKTFPCMLLAGLLPFGSIFIEFYFIFSAIWENQFYYLFGFLFVVLSILYISCSQIAIIFTYFLLCAENYHWWWKSFAISGGSAFYVMAYSVFYYYSKLNIIGFIPTLLYFSYSFLIAITFWILTGTIGFYAAYFFLKRIYAQVKID